MTDALKLMQTRQSCRSFCDKPLEAEKIVSCINAASLAPSACNTQPYHFYIAHAPEAVAVAAEFCKGERINTWVDSAKAFVLVTMEHADMPYTVSSAAKRDFRQFDSDSPSKTSALKRPHRAWEPAFSDFITKKSLKKNSAFLTTSKLCSLWQSVIPKAEKFAKNSADPLKKTSPIFDNKKRPVFIFLRRVFI